MPCGCVDQKIDKRVNVQPSFGVVKQGCPLSPLLFSIYLNDVDSLAEGVQDAITGIPNFTVTHLLFADDLSLTITDHNELQTMLNRLRVYAQKKSMTVNTQKSEMMCFICRPTYLCLDISNILSRTLSCLRLSGHNFLVQKMRHDRNRRPYELRICDRK